MIQPEPHKRIPDQDDKARIENVLLSHDIRSALSQIVHASHALEDPSLGDTPSVYVGQIKSAALYINDLLDDASSQNDGVPMSELEPLLGQLETLWSPEATQKGLTFSIVRKGHLPGALRMPKIDFLRIFNNILGNSLKFSTNGSLVLRVSRVHNGALLIEVVDDGPGFSADVQQKLFSLRGRSENAVTEGSGYGLFIARERVLKSGGEIEADNRPSGGARVSVTFPEDLLVASEKPVARTKPKTGFPDLSHLNILLAEDNPTNQLVATQMLKKMGARVETAADGVEALSTLEAGNFNLGLIDIEMPRKSGLEVMREMRARPDEQAEMTLLALTAYVLPEHRESIMASGADGIIAKPLTDIAAFGNAILIVTGAPEVEMAPIAHNPDADIQMDVYNGLKDIIGESSMLELLEKVNSDLADVRTGVQGGVAAKDTGPIRASTHILISVAGAFGAVNLQHLAESLNATAKSGDWVRITPEAVRCEQGITDVLRFVSAELGRP